MAMIDVLEDSQLCSSEDLLAWHFFMRKVNSN